MSNSLRGAVPFEVDGVSHHLRLTTNAQAVYEDKAGEDVVTALRAMFKAPNRRHVARVRRLFWAGLSHVPGMTEDVAGDMIDALGYSEANAIIGKAIALAMPELAAGNAPKAATQAAKTEPEPEATDAG